MIGFQKWIAMLLVVKELTIVGEFESRDQERVVELTNKDGTYSP